MVTSLRGWRRVVRNARARGSTPPVFPTRGFVFREPPDKGGPVLSTHRALLRLTRPEQCDPVTRRFAECLSNLGFWMAVSLPAAQAGKCLVIDAYPASSAQRLLKALVLLEPLPLRHLQGAHSGARSFRRWFLRFELWSVAAAQRLRGR